MFAFLGGIIFMAISLSLYYGVLVPSAGANVGIVGIAGIVVLAVGLLFLSAEFAYSRPIRYLYNITGAPMRPKGLGYTTAGVFFVFSSLAGCIVLFPDNVHAIARGDDVVFCMVLFFASWFFSYLVHAYFFSFFQRCTEGERHQPVLMPLIGNTVFVGLLCAVGFEWIQVDSATRDIILHPITVLFLFWVFTALTAILDIFFDIGVSKVATDITDYWQRSRLLLQHRNSDFGKPLLHTDWYQAAFAISQQKMARATNLKENGP